MTLMIVFTRCLLEFVYSKILFAFCCFSFIDFVMAMALYPSISSELCTICSYEIFQKIAIDVGDINERTMFSFIMSDLQHTFYLPLRTL